MAQETQKEGLAEFAPPEITQVAIPQEAKRAFSSKAGLGGGVRRMRPAAALAQEDGRVGHVGQVKQLEEAINGGARCDVGEVGAVNREAGPKARGQPFHFRAVSGGSSETTMWT